MDSRVDSARELLYGLTALRLGAVDRDGLAAALTAWTSTKGRPLAKVLISRGIATAESLRPVDDEVAAVLGRHGGDPAAALAAEGPVADEFASDLAADPFGTMTDMPTEAETGQAGPSVVLPKTSAGGASAVSPFDPFATLSDEQNDPDAEATQATLASVSPQASVTKGDPSSPASSVDGDDHAFLRYRVLRMHAKGGLGQVYVARDAELNREVALKEIQGKYADQVESRLRFLIEAEVTGGLEHPGIVPVYGLGRYPDGRPYYAMRFIRGESMREAIDRYHEAERAGHRDHSQREMGLRKLLGQLVDVCDAMSYAHSRGVLHRDLKPGNVMLGAFGETLVVDWGLAKFQDTPEGEITGGSTGLIRPMSAGSSSRTLFGTAVGTPQFMSPEQADGQLDKLGPSSDIYSLGAILYQILTGTTAFPDKQASVILDKVRKGDYPPPRSVNAKAPKPLEAICLKAMALKPGDRYTSARALADDLEHWMADEPVSVYREPLMTRAIRWAKRHKTAVASTAALLVTALISLGVYSVLIKREQERTARFYGLAVLAVERMLTELGEEDLANVPQMELVRRKMLAEAQHFYEVLLKERGNDPSARDDLARAGIRLGDIETFLGNDEAALARYDRVIGTLTKLHAAYPARHDLKDDLSRAYHSRGLLRRKLNRNAEAEADLKEALKLRTSLNAERPTSLHHLRDRIDTLYHLAALHARVDNQDARGEYDEVIRLMEPLANGPSGTVDDRRLLGRYLNNLANLLKREAGGLKPALAVYRKAEAIQSDVVARQPLVALTRYELAKTTGNLHLLLAGEKTELTEAETWGRRDLKISSELARDFPRVTDYLQKLVNARTNLGTFLEGLDRHGEAGKELNEAVTLGKTLVADHGERRDCRVVLASALMNRAALLRETNDFAAAESDYLDARQTLKPLAEAKTPAAVDVVSYGTAIYNLAKVRAALKRDDALATTDEAIRVYERSPTASRPVTGGPDPPLWLATDLKVALLERQRESLPPLERQAVSIALAETADRLPALRPDNAYSYIRAARAHAVCTFPGLYKGPKPDDPAVVQQKIRDHADRAIKLLREGVDRRLIKPAELDVKLYDRLRDRDDFRSIREAAVKAFPKPRS